MRYHQISDDDLETLENACAALELLVGVNGGTCEQEHYSMLADAIKRVRDDYGPHTNVTIIPAE